MVNSFTATRPNALFADNLIVTRPAPGERRTLFNRQFTLRPTSGPVERQVLRERSDYLQVLVEEFGLEPSEAELDAIMDLVAKHDPDRPASNHFA